MLRISLEFKSFRLALRCMFGLDQKVALESFELWLLVDPLVELTFFGQPRSIFRNLNQC